MKAEQETKQSWTVPQVMHGGGVKVGRTPGHAREVPTEHFQKKNLSKSIHVCACVVVFLRSFDCPLSSFRFLSANYTRTLLLSTRT